MATSPEDARAMVEACAAAGVRLGVAYHLRWNVGLRALRARVVGGELGTLRHMRVQWTYKAADASNWRARADVGRWWGLAGVGTHALDLVRWFLRPSAGEVVEVKSLIARAVHQGPHDETAIVALRFAAGATAEIVTSVLFASDTRVEIHGDKGAAIADGALGPHGAGKIHVHGADLAFKPLSPYIGEIADFVAAVRDGRPPEVDGEEGLRNVTILDQAAPREAPRT
jgi:1,5-anhydro-D-fructose reductase (1,5-anhydro-D-mannitol-forming)